MKNTDDKTFDVVDVLAVATAIHRKNGYIKKSAIGDGTPNVTNLYNHFYKKKVYEGVLKKDFEDA